VIASYAFGWATLTWWTYVILAAVTILSVWFACWATDRDERRAGRALGPCLTYMGDVFDENGFRPGWCFLLEGHEGDHRDHAGLTVTDRLYGLNQDH